MERYMQHFEKLGWDPEKVPPEEQFDRPEMLNLAGGDIAVHDVLPRQEKTPVPTVLAPGWSVTPETYKANIVQLVKAGRRVISPDAPHGVDTEPQDGYPAAELRKMASLMQALDAKGVERADVVTHSEGALWTVIAASLHPERFRNIVLVNPAGMISKDDIARLAVGFSKDIVGQVVRDITEKDPDRAKLNALTSLQTTSKGPLHTLREVFAIANSDIRGMLAELKQKGVGISVVAGTEDQAFPIERMNEVLDKDQLDGFYSVTGSHNELISQPEKHTALIDSALDALEKRPITKP